MLKKLWNKYKIGMRANSGIKSPSINLELGSINEVDYMCIQSLSPDVYEKWEIVKDHLISARHIKL